MLEAVCQDCSANDLASVVNRVGVGSRTSLQTYFIM